ncbi:MAG: glutamate-5-semialdehyde dehydrogenase [Clostridia bacterium]
MGQLTDYGIRLKKAFRILCGLNSGEKDFALKQIALSLVKNTDEILIANNIDVQNENQKGTSQSLIERLTLTKDRIEAMANSIYEVIALQDPTGKTLSGHTKENGLNIVKTTVPIGVIGMIYESRPNVTVDATVLAIKSSNCVFLRGSSSAINSNKAIVKAIKEGLEKSKVPSDACILIENTQRELVKEMITLNKYVDLVIPRGGAGLINYVTQNATVPTIETGVGNCHLYVDSYADLTMALNVLENGKVQRPSVCNALETLLVHKDVANEFLPMVKEKIGDKVEFRGCKTCQRIIGCAKASDEDYATEFLDYILSIKVVNDLSEAIDHIDTFGTKHSECIISENYSNIKTFQTMVDASCVYVNSSTRFTDGGEFGFGCEIGISTQKIHVRGPMALEHLVTTKYLITGNGQIR